MFKILLIASTFLLVVSFLSCSNEDYSEEGIKQICESIDTLLYNVKSEEYDWGSGEAYSYFTAFYYDSRLIFINERLNYRNDGEAINWYYIHRNNMIKFVERRNVYKNNSEDAGKRKTMHDLVLFITPSGQVINYKKVINRKKESLSSDESEWIYNHSKELLSIVKNRSKILKAK